MALHPEPSPDILVPFMSPNIAQILRTWIGAALLTGQVSMPSWNTPQPRNIPSSTSVPTYLFPWADAHHLEVEHSKRQCGKPRRPKPQLPLPPMKTATAQWQGNTQKLSLPTIQSNKLKSGIQLTMYDALKRMPPTLPDEYDQVWGHYPEEIDDGLTLRVVFANPRGLKLHSDILETTFSMGRCHSLGVGALCIAEANLNWGNLSASGKFHGLLRKIWKHSKVSKSYTKDDFQTENQPGGTVTIAVNHWTSRVIDSGEDPYGLGRWSYLVLRGKGGIKVLIVTAYRVCKQAVQSAGYKTSTAQQFMIKLVNTDAISTKIRSTLISTKASWNSIKRNHLKRNKFNVHNGSIRFPVRPLSSVIPIIISESETEKMDFDQTKNININEMLCELSIK